MKGVTPGRVRAVVVHADGQVSDLLQLPSATWIMAQGRFFVRLGDAYVDEPKQGVVVYAERAEPNLSPRVAMVEVELK